MPVHFGPCCGPRRIPDGTRPYTLGPQDTEHNTLVYETDAEAVERFLPEGFSVRKPYILATHKMHRNLTWLAGRGYNVVTFNVPVFYKGKEKEITGQYQLAIWENHADPILSGREQIGYTKVFAGIEDLHTLNGVREASMSSWDFTFCNLKFDTNKSPEDEALLKEIVTDPESEGLMHLKYIPKTGDGFSEADVCYVSFTPKLFPVPEDAKPLPPNPPRTWFTGDIKWTVPRWEDMPTQYHIVQGMASIPVKRIIGASCMKATHYNDVYHCFAIE